MPLIQKIVSGGQTGADRAALDWAAETLMRFIRSNAIKVLNVAGPRASKEPEIGAFVKQVLDSALVG